jgi:hypothetical protein
MNKNKVNIILAITSMFFTLPYYTQINRNYGLEIKSKTGFLIGKRGEVANLPTAHTFAGEASFLIFTNGKKKWHQSYKKPTVGLTVLGASVGNDEILGRFIGAYSFIDFPFIKNSKYQLSGKLGSGLAYTSKVYDPILNPKNSVISSHVNALICFGIQNKFIFKKHFLTLGLDLTHCSNGAYKVPNIGINMRFISLGYGFKIKESDPEIENISTLPFKKMLFGLTGIVSKKEIFPTGQGNSPIYGLSFFSRYFINSHSGIEIAFDIISKQSILKYKPEIEKTQLDLIQMGLFAGYLLPLDQFHLIIGMGVNIRDKYQPESLFYHRIGMRYYLNNGIHLNVVLRSNWAKADFAEWGIGYTLNYKK